MKECNLTRMAVAVVKMLFLKRSKTDTSLFEIGHYDFDCFKFAESQVVVTEFETRLELILRQ